jgi:adenosylmethionine-8-amino-7-oxononanoate aminotransferase
MTHVFHRHLRHTPQLAVAAQGMTIRDAAGRAYLDASGGAAVSSLGHGHPDVIAAMHAQIDKLAYAHTSFFTSEVAEQLADELIRTAPEGMSHVYLVSGGSEAVEAALKMARQYFVEKGQPQRTPLHRPAPELSRQHAGRAWRSAATSGGALNSAPILVARPMFRPAIPTASSAPTRTPETMGARLAHELERRSSGIGRRQVIAFVAETVVRRDRRRGPARARLLQARCARSATATACC